MLKHKLELIILLSLLSGQNLANKVWREFLNLLFRNFDMFIL
jgi:hypothetical protein